jgi:uncharacterized Zn finger protein
MQIPLSRFEQYIDETILKRGLSYFTMGHVSEVEEIESGVYEAIVTGSDEYSVRLEIQNNSIAHCVCSCPYDMGPVCKHIVSVLFYLQEDVLDAGLQILPVAKGKKNDQKPAGKKKRSKEVVNELLKKITPDELVDFIRVTANTDRAFRSLFLASFAAKRTDESKDLYAGQIKSILRSAAGRDGFIEWNQAGKVGEQVYELIRSAAKHIENGNYNSAIFICCAVTEEMIKAIQYVDDSNGDIGGNIEQGFELLSLIAGKELPEDTRVFLLDYCLSIYQEGTFAEWDWHLGLLSIASAVAKKEEIHRIIKELDKVRGSEYELDQALEIKFDILKRTEGQQEADRFAGQHITNPTFRTRLIMAAIESKDYPTAIRISKDGISQDKRDKPGLVLDWYDWLLKIAQAQNDKEKVIEYARLLFLDHFNGEQDYHAILKDNVATENWQSFVENIVADSIHKRTWIDFHFIATIYTREEWWEQLLKLLKDHPSFEHIERCEKSLATNHACELILLYDNEIREFAKNNSGRVHYQKICKYLRRIIKLGGQEQAEKIILFLEKQYPQRPALLEELKNV